MFSIFSCVQDFLRKQAKYLANLKRKRKKKQGANTAISVFEVKKMPDDPAEQNSIVEKYLRRELVHFHHVNGRYFIACITKFDSPPHTPVRLLSNESKEDLMDILYMLDSFKENRII